MFQDWSIHKHLSVQSYNNFSNLILMARTQLNTSLAHFLWNFVLSESDAVNSIYLCVFPWSWTSKAGFLKGTSQRMQ